MHVLILKSHKTIPHSFYCIVVSHCTFVGLRFLRSVLYMQSSGDKCKMIFSFKQGPKLTAINFYPPAQTPLGYVTFRVFCDSLIFMYK